MFLTEEFPPFNFHENNISRGLAVDLLSAITREAGAEVPASVVHIVPLNEGLATVRNTTGSVIFSIARTPAREDQYRWIGPFASYNIVLFSRRSDNITISSGDDLSDYTIGAVTSDVSVDRLIDLGVSPENIITDPDPLELIRLLDNGTIDLFTSGDIAGNYFITLMNATPESYRIVYRMDSIPLYYGFNKDTPDEIVTAFEAALHRLMVIPEDGGLSGYEQVASVWNQSSGLPALQYYTEEYYPFNFQKNGSVEGLSVDILREVYTSLNENLTDEQVVLGSWESGYHRTMNQSGTAIFSMARSPEREDLFLWAGPILTEPNVIFTLTAADSHISGPDDLAGLRIGAITDDIAALDLERLGCTDIQYATDPKTLITDLEAGTIDGWAYAEDPGRYLIDQFAENPDMIEPVWTLKTNDYYFAFNRETPRTLVDAFQRSLDRISTETGPDGKTRYDRILEKYNISSAFRSLADE